MSAETLTVAAYVALWLVLTGYVVLLARRQSRLEADLRALRASQEGSRTPSSPPPAPAARP
ncbi:MAG: CcmD family protein [Deltaproteobacteria bacterium]|nr:CcmD family protein [Deltaproteobacteria bacterium]